MQKCFRFLLFILWLSTAAGCTPASSTTETPHLEPTATCTPTSLPAETPTPSPEPAAIKPTVPEIIACLEGLPIEQFMEEAYRQLKLRDPDALFVNGYADLFGVEFAYQFTDLSAEYLAETQELERQILALLQTYDRTTLAPDQQISYDALLWYLDTQVRGHDFADYKLLVNPVWGLQSLPTDVLSEQPLETIEDAENYIALLASLDTWMDQVIEGLERNEAAGAVPPKFVLEETITQIDAILNLKEGGIPYTEGIAVYTNFRSKIFRISDISKDERDALLDAVMTEVEDTFIPAYRDLKDHLEHLSTIAVEDPDLWTLPSGEEYYNYLLAYYTGTTLNAEEIHAMGLAEVARTLEEIQEAGIALGLPRGFSMAELDERLTEELPVITGRELRQKYEQILLEADQAANDFFDLRSSTPVVIREESDGPPAFYMTPKPGSDDPGVMPVNLSFSPLWVNYNEYVLTHHETIPGHHLQLTLARELDVPAFQKYYITNPYLQKYDLQAYVEGWALYAETLAWEMGLYEDAPWENLGRLRLHLLRTVRIVVDTGIHAKGWTLDEAAAYLEETTGKPQTRAQLIRYLVNPGYPNAAIVGGLKITELRQYAMEHLGEDFDIKEFHNVILGHGILPVGLLEQVVEDWIAAQLTP